MRKFARIFIAGAIGVLLSSVAWGQGGVVLLGGDDLNDSGHGYRQAGVNIGGWKFIEDALRNMNAQVKRQGPFTVDVVALTSSPAPNLSDPTVGSSSPTAILSAATNAGLTVQYVDGVTEVNAFFASLAAGTVNPKIIWMPGDQASGGTDSSEEAALAANAAALNSFVGSGGGLMSHDSDYSWLSTVIPGLVHGSGCSSSSLALTVYGKTVFPNIADTDLRFDACHGNFSGNFGGLQVIAADSSRAIIIGGLTGSGGLTDPGQVGGNHAVNCFAGPVVTDVPVHGAITSTLPGPVFYTITSGNLGWGLTMNSDGSITGIPRLKGNFAYTLAATDANGAVSSVHCELFVNGPQIAPSITTACPLNSAVEGVVFSQSLSTSGGVGALTYSIISGALPAGLSLSTGGVISGTPSEAGLLNFTFQVSDSGAPVQTATKACSMTVGAAPAAPVAPVITSACPLPAGSHGTFYHTGLTADSTLPVTWTLTSGALPTGLSLSSNGLISGTPGISGVATFTITASNTAGSTSQACNLTINAPAPPAAHPPTINNACPLSSATVGSAYSQTFTSTNGTAPLSYSISAGAVPAGLTLSSLGVLSGTPTGAGTATFTVLVTDSSTPTALTGAQACSVFVNAAPAPATAPTISSSCPLPNGSELVNYTQALTATGGTAPYTFSLVAGELPRPLTLSSGGLLVGAPYHAGVYSFTLQVTGADNLSSQTACTLSVNAGGSHAQTSRGSLRFDEENADGVVAVGFELAEPMPFAVTGRAYLVARSKGGRDSEEIRFVSGGREADFVIEAGQTKARFSSDDFGIRMGDRSSELVMSVVLEANGTVIPVDLGGTEAVRNRADH